LILVAGLLLLRLATLAAPDLFPEEAYYWLYARHLDLGYLDHPPMVAWLIDLGTTVFGHGEFGVRIFAFLCHLVTCFFVFRLTALCFDRRAAWTAMAMLQVLPFFFMTGFMITPDAPLTACWAGALYFLARVFFQENGHAWLGLGVCLGLGMLSKYTIALIGPATLLFMALDPQSRRWFRHGAPYGAVLLSVVIFAPVLIWNAQHDWASFAYQGADRFAAPRRFSTHELLGSVLAVLTPVVLLLAIRVLAGRLDAKSSNASRIRLYCQVFTLVPLAVFVIFSITHRVKLNWTGPLWLAVIPAVAAQLTAAPSILTRRGWMTTVALACVIYPAFLIYLSFGLPGFGYSAKMELLPVGWSEMGFALERLKREVQEQTQTQTVVVGMDRNFIASETAFYAVDQAAAVRETTGSHLFGANQADENDGGSLMFEFWTPPSSVEGASLLLVSFRRQELDRNAIRKRCLRVGPITEHPITRNGKPICLYFTTVASGYRIPKRRAASVGLVPVGSRSVLGQSGSFDEMENKVRQARAADCVQQPSPFWGASEVSSGRSLKMPAPPF
jgi:dolichol-phosphate mannosyltransferase